MCHPSERKEKKRILALDIFATASGGLVDIYVCCEKNKSLVQHIISTRSFPFSPGQNSPPASFISFLEVGKQLSHTHKTLFKPSIWGFSAATQHILLLLQLFPRNFMKMYWKGPYAPHHQPPLLLCVSPRFKLNQLEQSAKDCRRQRSYIAYAAAEHSQRPS